MCVTAQRRQMLDQVLAAFEITPDYDLNLMRPRQTLTALTARVLSGLQSVLIAVKPSLVIVQGDTTTTLCAALAAFYSGIPVGHVEAGLRTSEMQALFPEEMNRVVAARLAELDFAATDWAADNLVRERVRTESIQVTGNTGIDAVLSVYDALERRRFCGLSLPRDTPKKLILVTAHRRESFREAFVRICERIAALAERDDVQVVWPVHMNLNVQDTLTTHTATERLAIESPGASFPTSTRPDMQVH